MADWILDPAGTGRLKQSATFAALQSSGLSLEECAPCGRLMLRARPPVEETRSRIARATGIDLPVEPNTAGRGAYPALWTGPGRWLINVHPTDAPEIADRIGSALQVSTFHLADINHARIVFNASGPLAPELLSRLCPLDLDEKIFGTGRCAQSLLARIPMLLHRVGDVPAYHLYVDRSLAHYAWDWLTDAAATIAKQGDAP